MAAPPVSADPGRSLYRGTAATSASARIAQGSAAVPARRMACANCHGRDARGGREGTLAAPPIDLEALLAPNDRRPAYSYESFARALSEGVDSGGRPLGPAMPRFDFSEAETRVLFDYLGRVVRAQATGVESDAVRFALVVPPGRRESGESIRAAFDRAWAELGNPRPHGRRPELLVAEIDAAAEDAAPRLSALRAFAILLPIPDRARLILKRAVEADVPVLFPFAQAEGSEDPQDLRTAFASVRDEIAAALEAAGNDAVIIADESGRARLRALGFERGRRIVTVDEFKRAGRQLGSALLLADGPAVSELGSADLRGVTIYRLVGDVLRQPSDPLSKAGATVAMTVPYDPKLWAADKLTAHRLAQTAARILRDALAKAGRDLTRARLMAAMDGVSVETPEWPALDFRRYRLSGTKAAGIVPAP